ncbi:MAG: hypothetical protein H7224_05055, partial [Polaromonas sp.]|nr:hypothetical protein [Polaromonas sp.]
MKTATPRPLQAAQAFKKLPTAQPAAVGLCPQRSADLLATLQSEVDRQRLPGAVVLVSRRGKVALFDS